VAVGDPLNHGSVAGCVPKELVYPDVDHGVEIGKLSKLAGMQAPPFPVYSSAGVLVGYWAETPAPDADIHPDSNGVGQNVTSHRSFVSVADATKAGMVPAAYANRLPSAKHYETNAVAQSEAAG
jgi:hypothetical protein